MGGAGADGVGAGGRVGVSTGPRAVAVGVGRGGVAIVATGRAVETADAVAVRPGAVREGVDGTAVGEGTEDGAGVAAGRAPQPITAMTADEITTTIRT